MNNTQKHTADYAWLSQIPKTEKEKAKDIDIDTIYGFTNDELSLQQKKRDQIITLYLAMITFFIPFTIELTSVTHLVKGIMFLFLSVIGLILGLIVMRYRIYKEVYWIALRTLSQLKNYPNEQMNKSLVQSLYYMSLCKIANKFVDKKKEKIKFLKLAKSSFFSAETLYFVLISFVSSAILAVALIFMLKTLPDTTRYTIAVCASIFTFISEYSKYTQALASVYAAAARPHDEKAFNKGFSKAWHLHFYETT